MSVLPPEENLNGDHFAVPFAATGDGKGRLRIKGDLSPATFRMHFSEGPNNLLVQFHHDCHPRRVEGHTKVFVDNVTCETSNDKTLLRDTRDACPCRSN